MGDITVPRYAVPNHVVLKSNEQNGEWGEPVAKWRAVMFLLQLHFTILNVLQSDGHGTNRPATPDCYPPDGATSDTAPNEKNALDLNQITKEKEREENVRPL